ncbi:hypothetical protein CABS03_05838 [Colletotrichum abscissum]|uniref:Uncharacterized protein n=1 Tax=Colletotrichum abscissum TaxID=1671311 RepID=A0A9P9X3U2_9PEZI|nr:hypothetical protein CABS02_12950 [Colletotrichum abscissum]
MLPLHDQTEPFTSQVAIPTGLFPPGHSYGHVLFLSFLIGPFSQDCHDRPWRLRLREKPNAFFFSPPGKPRRHPSFRSRLPATPGSTLQRRRQEVAATRREDTARHPLAHAHAHATVPCDLLSRHPCIHQVHRPIIPPDNPCHGTRVRPQTKPTAVALPGPRPHSIKTR